MGSLISVFALVGSAVVVAVESSGGLPPWADYGVLGAMVLGFLTRQIVPGYLYREQVARANELEAAVKALNDKLLESFQSAVPALRESTTAVLQATEEIRLIRSRRR